MIKLGFIQLKFPVIVLLASFIFYVLKYQKKAKNKIFAAIKLF